LNIYTTYNWEKGKAICYSGFREGQAPGAESPSYEQVKEDLLILHKEWRYLRLYDCDEHTRTVLEVIDKEGLNFKVMLGAYITAEMNNFGCPWGGTYSEEELSNNRERNLKQVEKLIEWANTFPEIINSLSVGNEAAVSWTDHYVPVKSLIEYAQMVKASASQPITFCENYVPWFDKLKPLSEVLDFISIHTYPVWEYKHIQEALEYTKQNYYAVCEHNPGIPVVITEAGWATNSNGRGIEAESVNEEFQKQYIDELMEWIEQENILCYVFEAFDEPWKGSSDPNEPEKHWGLYYEDRSPKLVAQVD
jgi:exo-beta-1,3-glucanase (GH17 family)